MSQVHTPARAPACTSRTRPCGLQLIFCSILNICAIFHVRQSSLVLLSNEHYDLKKCLKFYQRKRIQHYNTRSNYRGRPLCTDSSSLKRSFSHTQTSHWHLLPLNHCSTTSTCSANHTFLTLTTVIICQKQSNAHLSGS